MTNDGELRDRVARLEDREEIRECMMRYARGMDRRDREVLRSAYHDGAVDDHVGFIGEVDDFITGRSRTTPPRRATSTTCSTTLSNSTGTRRMPRPITSSSGLTASPPIT